MKSQKNSLVFLKILLLEKLIKKIKIFPLNRTLYTSKALFIMQTTALSFDEILKEIAVVTGKRVAAVKSSGLIVKN